MNKKTKLLEPAYLYADLAIGTSSEQTLRELAEAVKDPVNRSRNAIVHGGDVPLILKFVDPKYIKPVIDFPYGREGVSGKREQAERAASYGLSGADVVVNLWAVQDGDWDLVRDEFRAVKEIFSTGAEIKAITQTPFLWQCTRDKIEPLAKVLVEAGVSVWKDWTTVMNFSAKDVDISDEARIAYTEFLREIIGKNNLPLEIKIAGKVRAHNVVALKKAGADMFGVGVPSIKGVLEALEGAGY